MRILHIAPYNTAGVPITFVKAEKELGHYSRLLTLHHDGRGYQEDICLKLPLWQPEIVAKLKKICYPKPRLLQDTGLAQPRQIPPVWKPANQLAGLLLNVRDRMTRPLIKGYIKKYRLDSFDAYQLDGGHGFLKNDDFISKWHQDGKKVICCYLGSDLRRRGVMPGMDKISDLTLTLEWDHLKLYPGIKHLYFPFDISGFKVADSSLGKKVRIGHSPTNRAAKGSDRIIDAVNKLSQRYPVELVLIENRPHLRALELKATCDIGIDQLGDLGYGISALEWLAMGIPAASSIASEMEAAGISHPIVSINEQNIEQKLEPLINSREQRIKLGRAGRQWLEQNHDAQKIVKQIHQSAGLN
ncbi:MAG: hypothetical protein A2509_08335 [Candidatus Edwardsbacteria bacterium RIFOXYD12_FULL_50_11]|uniref:Glycosyl transferase family 1 domain-containing protein n=1 Tax=Candidatus Edwardsbacteria bacterium GWF2_54_11 TaxID=1817851 RepID=A0A1F5RGV4_9BACT|nr:MAG: hypothetical protein A2502_01700 [Candidatus Edwardsbacteria bacterium RifOxyC12_full_54_24]OGF08982.1 MAG: hypothetical protein A2273_10155 [Candidatus Edwardsbacteria bacterium RifOxyA12_full_54_48]OGF12489.1 MAG: hypothetical protein A3K15_01425 [Candidatus Edwardsbacteria bacterium GWE2_54_12]OGF13636.1 MAG: hypothetical protein A2024_10880 [Candidatus Edwardsbacteria bacterium GWF2_54_11]OGF17406.1 MAG: hypothetical protein A2509_08335 [Candidatus Edwardsbacteria bacterium RIFOXYD1